MRTFAISRFRSPRSPRSPDPSSFNHLLRATPRPSSPVISPALSHCCASIWAMWAIWAIVFTKSLNHQRGCT
jgi:hypothetical protein